MEKQALRSLSTQSKIIGTIVSISGAVLVVLYRGPTILSSTSSASHSEVSLQWFMGSPQSNWVIGGLFLTAEYLLTSIWFHPGTVF